MATSPRLELAVILARGLGTRMRTEAAAQAASKTATRGHGELDPAQAQAAAAGLKAMMPFRRPFLEYQLSRLADAGFRRAALVLGPEHESVRAHFARQPPRRLELTFAEQALPRGTADAVLAAEAVTGSAEFAVVNGDNLYPTAALATLRELDGPGLVAFTGDGLLRDGNIPPERLRAFALLAVDRRGFLREIVEKPDAEAARALGPGALVSMTCWRFSPAIFAACRAVAPSVRGELELPDAVRLSLVAGGRYRVALSREPVLDLSRREDVPGMAALLAGLEADP